MWLKEIAPSDELRTWYNHEPLKWQEFQQRYRKELRNKQNLLQQIKQLENDKHTVTLLFSSKETQINNATALKIFLEEK